MEEKRVWPRIALVMVALVLFVLLANFVLSCRQEQTQKIYGNKERVSCDSTRVEVKDVFIFLDKKKVKIAQIKVNKCFIKINVTDKTEIGAFLFQGLIEDTDKKSVYPANTMLQVDKNGEVMMQNPFYLGSSKVWVAYKQKSENKFKPIESPFIFNFSKSKSQ